ncbi:autotransporter domain-containing protein [Halodesulfovibrio aestuarii]|uniref:autotransporter outer membrane beta-barrel domain-containing protein n=1 Tax=Halodesulfovibrio aestuarii TaxID=126333 RepID=UPI003D32B0A0
MKKLTLALLLFVFPFTAHAQTTFTISPKAIYFSYHEQVMDETGYLAGINTELTHTTNQGYFFGLEAEGLGGELRYEGKYSDGTGLSCDTHDFLFQATAAVGKEFTISSWQLTPYTGLKYRYWRDDIITEGGYLRQISQFYLPVGLTAQYDLDDSWNVKVKMEGSLLLAGRVYSNLSDAGSMYPDITNHQSFGSGVGARISTTLQKNLGSYILGISPYFEWYEVKTSKKASSQIGDQPAKFIEPHNTTWMLGLSCSLSF